MVHVHRSKETDYPAFWPIGACRSLSALTAACVAIRREVFFEVGQFDATDLQVTSNDVDLCLRICAHGYRVVWTPFAELYHLEGRLAVRITLRIQENGATCGALGGIFSITILFTNLTCFSTTQVAMYRLCLAGKSRGTLF